MTTKRKIIAGFVIMVLLLVVVAVIGYRSLNVTKKSLTEYNRLANLTVSSSDILANQNAAAAASRQYLISMDPTAMEEARQLIRKNQKIINEQFASLDDKTILNVANSIRTHSDEQIRFYDAVEKYTVELMDLYSKNMIPTLLNVLAEYRTLIQALEETGNNRATLAAATVISDLTRFASGANRFTFTRSTKDWETVQRYMAALEKSTDALRAAMVNNRERAAFAKVQQFLDEIIKTINTMYASATEQTKNIQNTATTNTQIEDEIHTINDLLDKQMKEVGALALATSKNAEKAMLGISVGGLILGSLLAAFIIFGLIKVLHDVRNFAAAIANGEFNTEVNNTEGGEIGEMLAAMREIPAVLQSILNDYQKFEKRIASGELDANVDPSAYKGGFATLVNDTNDVLNCYLAVIDTIPSPILAMDKGLRVSYMNACGRGIAGSDYKGKTEKQVLYREDADTPTDALRKTVETRQPTTAETIAHPRDGVKIDISYANTPMFDDKREFVSVIQLVTDLTAIKKTERSIRNAAEQASSISNRLASASEELSAQVNQVSYGTEQQRSRVESTAAAMTQMNSTVLDVAKNASQGAEQSEMTKNKASDGAVLVNKVVNAISQVNQVASLLQANMEELGSQAKSIGSVMNVISDIADQTNLLALNAAIEAARAGEAGRGFAVVADEVRKLAEKTMEATQEVGSNISAIQKSAHTNIEEVNKAAKAISEATQLAASSGRALDEIVNLATANSSIATSIAAAAEEQSTTSEEINQSVDGISTIVAEISEGMTQSAAAVKELSQMAQELNRIMYELR